MHEADPTDAPSLWSLLSSESIVNRRPSDTALSLAVFIIFAAGFLLVQVVSAVTG